MSDRNLDQALFALRVRFHTRLAHTLGIAIEEAWIRNHALRMDDRAVSQALKNRYRRRRENIAWASAIRAILNRFGLSF